MPHFAEPQWLWLAVLGALLVFALQRYAAVARRQQARRLVSPRFLPGLDQFLSHGRRRLKHGMLLAVVAAIGVALARPQWGIQPEKIRSSAEDFMVLLDCSRSMLADDVQPTRLQRARLALFDLIEAHGDGRVGLVAFAGQAFLQCPLTFDREALREALFAVDERTIPTPGTDLGRALDEGFQAMDKEAKRKFMVLVTDGEDLERGGVAVAKMLAQHGVTVHTVGVGSPAGTEIRLPNEQGVPDLVRDGKGQVVRSRLDEPILRAIAEATRGRYHTLESVEAEPDALLRQLEGTWTGGPASNEDRGVERFHVPLLFAILFLVVESFVGTMKRRTARGARDRLTAVLFLSPFLTLGAASPQSARELYNLGTEKLDQGDLASSEGYLYRAASSQQEAIQGSALYNLGWVRFRQGQEKIDKGPDRTEVLRRAEAARLEAENLLRRGTRALAGTDLQELAAVYRRGRGVRKGLKDVVAAVEDAVACYGSSLALWQRAAGDFHGAAELASTDVDALHNAGVVERHIARLIDSIRPMREMPGQLGQKRRELEQMLDQIKARLPDGLERPGPGEEEEEEDSSGPKPGTQEIRPRDGTEKPVSPEDAARLLRSIQLDRQRTLPMGQKSTGPPKERKSETW